MWLIWKSTLGFADYDYARDKFLLLLRHSLAFPHEEIGHWTASYHCFIDIAPDLPYEDVNFHKPICITCAMVTAQGDQQRNHTCTCPPLHGLVSPGYYLALANQLQSQLPEWRLVMLFWHGGPTNNREVWRYSVLPLAAGEQWWGACPERCRTLPWSYLETQEAKSAWLITLWYPTRCLWSCKLLPTPHRVEMGTDGSVGQFTHTQKTTIEAIWEHGRGIRKKRHIKHIQVPANCSG